MSGVGIATACEEVDEDKPHKDDPDPAGDMIVFGPAQIDQVCKENGRGTKIDKRQRYHPTDAGYNPKSPFGLELSLKKLPANYYRCVVPRMMKRTWPTIWVGASMETCTYASTV